VACAGLSCLSLSLRGEAQYLNTNQKQQKLISRKSKSSIRCWHYSKISVCRSAFRGWRGKKSRYKPLVENSQLTEEEMEKTRKQLEEVEAEEKRVMKELDLS